MPTNFAVVISIELSTFLVTGAVVVAIASLLIFVWLQYHAYRLEKREEYQLQQAKNELLSLASHQLRTPATGVKQYLGMVLEGFAGKLSSKQQKLLERAYTSNERQLQIINEFLYVAKLGVGNIIITRKRFEIVPLVRDIIEEMQSEIAAQEHDLQVDLPASALVKADEHSVRMILENLLSNAIKYTKPGGKIHVRITRSSREVRVSIQDNGVGIARQDMQQLFKQFTRIPNELSSRVSGTGVGLYLAQQLATRNNGSITVTSEVDIGSTFTLRLPGASKPSIRSRKK